MMVVWALVVVVQVREVVWLKYQLVDDGVLIKCFLILMKVNVCQNRKKVSAIVKFPKIKIVSEKK